MSSYFLKSNTGKEDCICDTGNESKKTPFFNRLKKIGNIKNLAIIFVLLVVAVLLYNFSGFANNTSDESIGEIGYTTSLEYIDEIESKLINVIGNIKGVGNINVMVSINSSPELEVATNVEEKVVTTASGTTTVTTRDPIIVEVNGKDGPLILKETLPTINGVIVVSSGAKDIKVKLDIITAVSTALGINPKIIEVFEGVWLYEKFF